MISGFYVESTNPKVLTMKSLMTQIALLAGCLSLSACILSENPEKEPTTLTKAQAKKIQHPKGDL